MDKEGEEAEERGGGHQQLDPRRLVFFFTVS
jgi:hypothetical protein